MLTIACLSRLSAGAVRRRLWFSWWKDDCLCKLLRGPSFVVVCMHRSAKPFVLGVTDVVSLQVRPECCKVHHVTWSRDIRVLQFSARQSCFSVCCPQVAQNTVDNLDKTIGHDEAELHIYLTYTPEVVWRGTYTFSGSAGCPRYNYTMRVDFFQASRQMKKKKVHYL